MSTSLSACLSDHHCPGDYSGGDPTATERHADLRSAWRSAGPRMRAMPSPLGYWTHGVLAAGQKRCASDAHRGDRRSSPRSFPPSPPSGSRWPTGWWWRRWAARAWSLTSCAANAWCIFSRWQSDRAAWATWPTA